MSALVAAALALLLWPCAAVRGRTRRRKLSADQGARPVERVWTNPGMTVAGSAAMGTALGAVASTPLVAGLAGLLTGLAARAWLRSRRSAADSRQLLALARGIAALSADLRSGRPLAVATAAAAAACGDEPTGAELVQAIRVPERGTPNPGGALDGALDGRRNGALAGALERISGAVALSTRTGCSLAAVLGALEDDLRARHRHALELRAATSGPRAGAVLLAGLPVLGLAMGSGVGADPWSVLTSTGTGQVLLVAGVGLELAGIAWTTRLVGRALR